MDFLGIGSLINAFKPKPSFGSQVWDATKTGVASAVGSLPGQAMHGAIGGHLSGQAQKSYMDAAYPGTNPEQRLAGSTGSAGAAMANPAVQAAQIKADSDKYVADRQTEVARDRWKTEKTRFDALNAAHLRKAINEAGIGDLTRRFKEVDVRFREEEGKHMKRILEDQLTKGWLPSPQVLAYRIAKTIPDAGKNALKYAKIGIDWLVDALQRSAEGARRQSALPFAPPGTPPVEPTESIWPAPPQALGDGE